MKLQQQVTSLEISKRLKELGVKQESLFYHLVNENAGVNTIVYKTNLGFYHESGAGYNNRIIENANSFSAFTVAELGDMLPTVVKKDGENYYLDIRINSAKEWIVDYRVDYKDSIKRLGVSEADARGKMLIYLLENKLINE